jgi:enamine deaminase RidA (YjgF/YER057c/UK114 family)
MTFLTRSIDTRLRSLGLTLPTPPDAVGAYAPVVVRERLGFVSGQFPLRDGRLIHVGRVGSELGEEEGREAARMAALNAVAQIRRHLAGFEGFAGLLRMDGYVASAPGFHAQPGILDAASELLSDMFGPTLGVHARTAFSVDQLPMDAPVELCLSFATSE